MYRLAKLKMKQPASLITLYLVVVNKYYILHVYISGFA